MNTAVYFASPKIIRRIHVGPLGAYVDDFAMLLQEQCYSRSSARGAIRIVAKWSRWLYGRDVDSGNVDVKLLELFLVHAARTGVVGAGDRLALQKMLAWLQKTGVAHATSISVVSQHEIVRNDFGQYLSQERGLSPDTLKCYLPHISQFLAERFGDKSIEFDALVAEDVTGFVQRNSHCLSHNSVQHLVTALRGFLR